MGVDALPCIVCGKELENIFGEESDNQPYEGTAFQSEGHYGSTIWDPMDRAYIEITVCDDCLRAKSAQVLQGRAYKLVMCRGMYVGTTAAERPLVPWNPDDSDDGVKPLEVEPEDIHAIDKNGKPLFPEIHWAHNADERKRLLLEQE